MSIAERPPARTSYQIPAPSENLLLAVIAAAFLALHIAAGVMLINASSVAAPAAQEEVKPPLYD